jgi:hypothetical protein
MPRNGTEDFKMANSYQSNPLSFTIAGTSLKSFKGPKYLPTDSNGRFRVKRVVWSGSTTNGDTFSVTDNAGNVLASGSAVTASIGLPQTVVVDELVTDVLLFQISSGLVQIYIERE